MITFYFTEQKKKIMDMFFMRNTLAVLYLNDRSSKDNLEIFKKIGEEQLTFAIAFWAS